MSLARFVIMVLRNTPDSTSDDVRRLVLKDADPSARSPNPLTMANAKGMQKAMRLARSRPVTARFGGRLMDVSHID